MELTHEFSVRAPIEEAWAVLTDLERVAPCMPGFELLGVEGEAYRGAVRVKVGPMTARYQGSASFRERDGARYRAVVRAEGRETRGQGSAAATVTATLLPADGGTRVTLHTDLAITGRVAQFGRGVLADVSRRLLDQFVRALETDVLAAGSPSGPGAAAPGVDAPGPTAAAPPHEAPGGAAERRGSDAASGAPLDLLATAGPSLLKRLAPLLVLGAIALLWLLCRG